MKKAFFSADAGIASILIVIIMVLIVFSFNSTSSAIAQRSLEARGQLSLLERADFMLKKCSSEGGMAECDSSFLRSHELVDNGNAYILSPGETQTGFCVKRLVLVNGDEKILAVCAE
ncbi:MAG: hypothetical protein V1811_01315 [Candidatus Micrarchaeota archaeon]